MYKAQSFFLNLSLLKT